MGWVLYYQPSFQSLSKILVDPLPEVGCSLLVFNSSFVAKPSSYGDEFPGGSLGIWIWR